MMALQIDALGKSVTLQVADPTRQRHAGAAGHGLCSDVQAMPSTFPMLAGREHVVYGRKAMNESRHL